MTELPVLIELAKLFMNNARKTGNVPPIDPAEIAKCVRDLQLKLIEEKKADVQVSDGKAKLGESKLSENMRKLDGGMRIRYEKKKTILHVPVGKEEHVYEFNWLDSQKS